jgi:hypothetical protein
MYRGQEQKFNTAEAMAAIASFLDMYLAVRDSVYLPDLSTYVDVRPDVQSSPAWEAFPAWKHC